jgi:hypothetical protein
MWSSQRQLPYSSIFSNTSLASLQTRQIGRSKHCNHSTTDNQPRTSSRKSVDEIRDYERGWYLSCIEAATRLASFHISEEQPGVKRLPIQLPGRHHGQMARKNGSESDATLLVRYMSRPRHPELDDLTYVEFGSRCRLEKHDPDEEMHP